MSSRPQRALVAGHFSTIGDIACLEFVRTLLAETGLPFDVTAFAPSIVPALEGGVAVASLEPERYSHLIVVCGPVWPGLLEKSGIPLARYEHCCRIGLNLTMLEPVAQWNPFDYLLERDSERLASIDLAFVAQDRRVPIVAVCLIDSQPVYEERQLHAQTRRVVEACLMNEPYATLRLDTKWPRSRNEFGIRDANEFSSLLATADVLITNRLHGLVYGAKRPMPVIAIDSVLGGDKVTKQARLLGASALISAESLSVPRLQAALRAAIAEPLGEAEIARTNARKQTRNSEARNALRHAVTEARRRADVDRSHNPLPPTPVSGSQPVGAVRRARALLRAALLRAANRL